MWPFRRKNAKLEESQAAITDARQAVSRVQARTPEVREVSKTLKDIRERNHFADQLRITLGGG